MAFFVFYSMINVECNVSVLQVSVSIDVLGEDVYHFQPRLFGKVLNEF